MVARIDAATARNGRAVLSCVQCGHDRAEHGYYPSGRQGCGGCGGYSHACVLTAHRSDVRSVAGSAIVARIVARQEQEGTQMTTIPVVHIWDDHWTCGCGVGGAESDPLGNYRAAVKHQDTVHVKH